MPTPELPAWFAEPLDRELSSSQKHLLYRHYEMLIHWNQRMNLTTVKPGAEMVRRHYCESLFFASHLPAAHERISVMDVGSGAGFPGIPMAILRPDWKVTLVESNRRKAVFLRESSRSLPNVSVLAQRMENAEIQADWLVARAIDPQEVLHNVPRLAPDIGLMLGEDDFSAVRSNSRITWREPVRIPGADRRLCIYGRCFTWNTDVESLG